MDYCNGLENRRPVDPAREFESHSFHQINEENNMAVQLVDKNNIPLNVGDYVMIGLKCSSMGDIGKVVVSQIENINGYGALVSGESYRIKAPWRFTKVSNLFAKMWNDNSIFTIN